MARWIPSSWGPATGRSRGRVAPPARRTLSNSSTREWASTTVASGASAAATSGSGRPTEVRHRNSTPSATIWSMRRSSTAFSILNSGMP